MSEEMVTISKQKYIEMQRALLMYQALQECGVDNWEGYSDAQDIFMTDAKAAGLLTKDEEDENDE